MSRRAVVVATLQWQPATAADQFESSVGSICRFEPLLKRPTEKIEGLLEDLRILSLLAIVELVEDLQEGRGGKARRTWWEGTTDVEGRQDERGGKARRTWREGKTDVESKQVGRGGKARRTWREGKRERRIEGGRVNEGGGASR